jgi:hypothetical protein
MEGVLEPDRRWPGSAIAVGFGVVNCSGNRETGIPAKLARFNKTPKTLNNVGSNGPRQDFEEQMHRISLIVSKDLLAVCRSEKWTIGSEARSTGFYFP